MTGKSLLRSFIAVLFAAACAAAQAGAETPSVGQSLRESALIAARQRSVVEAAFRETAASAVLARSATPDPMSDMRKLDDPVVTFDFCIGSHLLTTSNLDPVSELIVHP